MITIDRLNFVVEFFVLIRTVLFEPISHLHANRNQCLSASRPKLVAGSPEGYNGHVDGKPREARLNHPKGLTVDDRGNIYVADTMNMAIRKISDTGRPRMF